MPHQPQKREPRTQKAIKSLKLLCFTTASLLSLYALYPLKPASASPLERTSSRIDTQEEALSQWRAAVDRSLPSRSPEDRRRVIETALTLSENLFQSRGVRYQRVVIDGVSEEVLHILAIDRRDANPLNQLAARVEQSLRGLNLVYAPSVLMGGTAGFYSQKEHLLGISHDHVETQNPDSTFFHEIIHASHGVGRSLGILDPLSPSARVLSKTPGVRISKYSRGYSRIQSFEEIEAHVESLKHLAKILPQQTPSEQDMRWAESILNEIYHVANEGEGVTLATQDLSLALIEKLKALPSSRIEWKPHTEGPTNDLPNYMWSIILPGHTNYPHLISASELQSAVEVKWLISPKHSNAPLPNRQDLIRQLDRAVIASSTLSAPFRKVRESMYWLIERADGRRTDFRKVHTSIHEIVESMENWKAQHSPTPILLTESL